MLKSAGRFFIISHGNFPKQYHTPSELVHLLQRRGLHIDNAVKAEDYIKHIGYYRLSAYFYPFLEMPKSEHRFKPETSFEKVKEYEKSNEDFIKHFKTKYTDAYPPAWELIEILPLGVVTRIYENLRDYKVQKKIAKEFGLNTPVLQSWLTLITLTRNACCHHSRVWNKMNAITTLSMKKMQRDWLNNQPNQQKVYYNLCLIKYFLNVINPANDLKQKLVNLFRQYPSIDLAAMGFTDGWDLEPLWKG